MNTANSIISSTSLSDPPSVPLMNQQRKRMITKLIEFQTKRFLPDSFIEYSATFEFLETVNAAVLLDLPKRRQLGGQILDEYSAAIQSEGSNDMVVYKTKTGEHMDKAMKNAESSGWLIGAVVTDDAGESSRARRILALRWPHLIFLKFFAHDVNDLAKAALRTPSSREVTCQATEVVNALHASSSKWLVRAQEVMIQTYGYERKFIRLCDTRWNSKQGCFASLLRVKTTLR
ncbi:hypothetical protein PHMEG_00022480, partial [Phytophthora megakarya]